MYKTTFMRRIDVYTVHLTQKLVRLELVVFVEPRGFPHVKMVYIFPVSVFAFLDKNIIVSFTAYLSRHKLL